MDVLQKPNKLTKTLRRCCARPDICLHWSVIALTLAMSAASNSTNRCKNLTSGDSENKWGHNCSRPCHCHNNSACGYDGACLEGCQRGFELEPHTRRCVLPPQPAVNEAPLMSDVQKSRRPKKEPAATIGHEATVYRFAPPGTCLPRAVSGYEKLWRMSTNKPILVESIHVIYDTGPNYNDSVFAKICIANHSQLAFQMVMSLRHEDNMRVTAFTRVERFTIADSIEIRSLSSEGVENCSAAIVAAVVVYGQTVCPYRRWGANCEKDCQCPCEVAQCHPSTGDCWTRGFACTPGMYGPTCLRRCSDSCGGSPMECHVLSGVCKTCFGGDREGVRCERRLSGEEVAARRSECERFKQDVVPKLDTMAMQVGHVQAESRSGGSPKSNTSLMVAMATVVVLVTFAIACGIYFMLIRHCAKERLKKIAEIDKERKRRISMMSYSELHKEYTEMIGRSRTDLKATRSICSGHQIPPVPPRLTISPSVPEIPDPAPAPSSRLLGMFRWNRRLFSIIKGPSEQVMGDHDL